MRPQSIHIVAAFAAVVMTIALLAAGGQAASPPAGTTSTITIPVAADTFITNRFPQTNFGDDDYLELWYESGDDPAGAFLLVAFELREALGTEVIIDSATLELYQIEAGSGANPVVVTLHPILEPWDEMDVTYDEQPAITQGPYLPAASIGTQPGWKQFDVTQFADNWLAGDGFGVELRSLAQAFERVFESDEHNEHRPRLVVEYHRPTPTPTATATHTPRPDTPVTYSLCATADSYVNEGSPAANYGGASRLKAGYGEGQNEPFAFRSLVRFDLSFIPPGSEIVDAHFLAGQVLAGGLPLVELPLYAVREPWGEFAVTWNNQPPTSPQPAATAAVDDAVPSVISWEIRALVREWVGGGLTNNGLALRGPESGPVWMRQFDSHHYTPFCPTLVVEVIANGPMPSPTPTPTPTATATAPPPCPQPDAAGNTLAQAAPLAPFKDTAETLCPSGDLDYWKFPVVAGQEIKLSLWGMTGDYDLLLIDPDGALVQESALWGAGRSEYIYHLAYRDGEFRALVKGKGAADWHPTSAYKLRVELPFKCFEPDEAGDTIGSAKSILPSLPQAAIQRPVSAILCPEGDIDFFRFYVPGGQQVTVRIDLTDLPADYDLVLYDPARKAQATSTQNGLTPERIEGKLSNWPGYWSVAVDGPALADGTHPYHSQPYTLDVQLSSPADLTVQGIEITQAIQTMDNSVALASDKLTMARVYVDGGVAPGPLSGVEVKLTAWRVAWGVPQPLPGALTQTVFNLPQLALHQSRLDNSASLNFILPQSWVTAGTLRLQAEVNPAQSVPETDFGNNTLTDDVAIIRVQPVNVGLVAVKVNNVFVDVQTDPDVLDMIAWTRQVYPTGDVKIWYLPASPVDGDYSYTFPGDGTCGSGWAALLIKLTHIFNDWTDRPANTVVFGAIHSAVPGGPSGCGRQGQNASAVIMGSNTGPFMAHELGHNFNRDHAPCGLGAGVPYDTQYPTYYDPSGAAYLSASTGEVGINTTDWTIFDPIKATDLMSYCRDDAWISPYTWWGILKDLDKTAAGDTGARADIPTIMIGGVVRGGVATFDPFWVENRPAGSSDEPVDGPYSIRLLNAGGQVLGERRLAVAEPPVPADHDTGYFLELMPYPTGTAAVALYKDGAKLAERLVSIHAPQVTVLAPNGGEQWVGKGPYTVRWQASDADGDALTAKVLYSADGGSTWSLLATNLDGRQVTLDTTYLPGGAQARIRVVVTDGVLTTFDQSDAVFTVDNKPPLVLLLNPRQGTYHGFGRPVILQALATDPEEGPLPAEDLVWTVPGSGRSGTSGNDVVLDGLPAGQYTVAVTARDASGLATSREAAISVGWHLFLPTVNSR